jgi:hypothetical protein
MTQTAKAQLLALLEDPQRDSAQIQGTVTALELQRQRGSLPQLAGTWHLRWTSGTRNSQRWQRGLWMQSAPADPPGKIYQRITLDQAQAAEPYLETIAAWGPLYLTVAGPFTYGENHRFAFTFEKTALGWGKLPALTVPMGNWAKGWLQTTYLDGDLHIERGDRGGISVYTRCDPASPAATTTPN